MPDSAPHARNNAEQTSTAAMMPQSSTCKHSSALNLSTACLVHGPNRIPKCATIVPQNCGTPSLHQHNPKRLGTNRTQLCHNCSTQLWYPIVAPNASLSQSVQATMHFDDVCFSRHYNLQLLQLQTPNTDRTRSAAQMHNWDALNFSAGPNWHS